MRLSNEKMQTTPSRAIERAILIEGEWRSNDFRKPEDYFCRVSLMASGVSFWTVTLRVTVVYPSSFS
jgi:hypothetical protein